MSPYTPSACPVCRTRYGHLPAVSQPAVELLLLVGLGFTAALPTFRYYMGEIDESLAPAALAAAADLRQAAPVLGRPVPRGV